MTNGERLEQQSGEERESRVSFGEVLRNVSAPPPVPGKYTLAPPDVVPVADELSPRPSRSLGDRIRDNERMLKRAAIAFAVGFGLVMGLLPARPVEPAPRGTFSEADLSAEVVPTAAADAAERRRTGSVARVMRNRAPDPAPHVIRLPPIELVVAVPADEPVRQRPRRAEGPTPRVLSALDGVEVQGKTDEAPSQIDAVAGTAQPVVEAGEADAAEGGDAELPVTPAREDVAEAMARVHQAVRDCAPGSAGSTVQVRTTFLSSGSVTTAMVDGALAGTPEGSCVARAVRDARLPEFQQDSFVVAYPFAL